MAFGRSQTLPVTFMFFIIAMNIQDYAHGADPKVPCYFIFGDSLSDAGNNNDLHTLSKADFPPYGVDFPVGATGRYTNGRTFVDFLSESLGFNQYIPPFWKAKGSLILKGANYASGGSGILKATTKIQGERLWLGKQLSLHAEVVARTELLLRNSNESASEHLSKCIYTVDMGSNDYINNYYSPSQNPISQLYNPDQFATLVSRELKTNLELLHEYGARKVVVIGLTGIGCCPHMAKKFGGNPCSEKINTETQLFNDKLVPMVKDLNQKLSDAKFTFLNASSMFNTLLQKGLLNSVDTCCKLLRTTGTCVPYKDPCANRSEYVFFDGFHPTEATNKILADVGFNAKPPVIAPYDFEQLLKP